jgi:hypothetical protein
VVEEDEMARVCDGGRCIEVLSERENSEHNRERKREETFFFLRFIKEPLLCILVDLKCSLETVFYGFELAGFKAVVLDELGDEQLGAIHLFGKKMKQKFK